MPVESGSSAPISPTPSSSSAPSSSAPSGCAVPTPDGGWGRWLWAAQFVSPTQGWVVGTDGILATADGTHWSEQYAATAPGFDGVDFVDSEHGWAVGPNAIVRTTDGGAHWQKLTEPCPQLASVHFVSATSGFGVADSELFGENGELMTTSDAGTTWQRLPSPSGLQNVCIDSSGHGWLGASGDIYGTSDNGAHWTLRFTQPTDGNGTEPYEVDVQCAGSGAAWAEMLGGGAMSKQAHLGLHTNGVTWSAIFAEQFFPHPGVNVDADAPSSYFGAFSAVSPTSAVFVDNCVACDAYGVPMMETTTDGGAHLSKGNVVANLTDATGASFVTVDDGWVMGSDQLPDQGNNVGPTFLRIEHTADGGHTWTTQYSTQ
jgi:Photosynthesis system II assembly factor YCF48